MKKVKEIKLNRTRIDWCDFVWNPVWGCKTGCKYCYARKIAKRFWKNMFRKESEVIWEENAVTLACLKEFKPVWLESNYRKAFPKKPSRIFVNSMSDIHWWEEEWMLAVLERIKKHPEHVFIFLTKFPKTYYLYDFPENCWLGVTLTGVEPGEKWVDIDFVFIQLKCKHNIRFISLEPFLSMELFQELKSNNMPWFTRVGSSEPIINWLIIGAQTNPYKAPKREWLEAILKECEIYDIPVFIKDNVYRAYPDLPILKNFPL